MKFFERFFRFGIVGVLGVVVNFVGYILLRDKADVPDFFSKAFAIEISILSNFLFNYFWTWGDRGKTFRTFWRRLIRYHGSTFIASFVVTIAVSYLMRIFVGMIEWEPLAKAASLGLAPTLGQERWVAYISYLIGIAAGMIANFILSDRWVFTKQKTADVQQDGQDERIKPGIR
ncbi:MAG: GtrA family protein [bacterium]